MFQYFFIKSRLSAKVMDIDGESRDAGTHVIMYDKKDHSMENTNQLFYMDPSTHSIRSALTDFCLSLNGDNELVVEHFSGAGHQEWDLDGDKIRNRNDGQVIDISGEDDGNGAKMCKWSEHGGLNQQWDFEYIEPQYFYIRSHLNQKVMDVDGADADSGTHVIMYEQNDGHTDNQLWFTTGNQFIRSKLNGFALDCQDGDIKLYPFNEHSQTQGFRLEGDHIVSMHDQRCVDIAGEDEDNGAKLCAWERHENNNQRWYTQNI